jgi:FdhD protein
MRTYLKIRDGTATEVRGAVVAELPLTVFVNGQRLVTMLCSPFDLDALVVGYLWTEGVIDGVGDISRMDVSAVDGRAEVDLATGLGVEPAPRTPDPVRSTLRVAPHVVWERVADLAAASVHYKQSRGIHSAALGDADRLLFVAEDVARRNALDKLKGQALLRGAVTEGRILVSSGRISSELLLRAARMAAPIVASRTSPTDMAIRLAERLDITVCGYVRPGGFNLYTGAGVAITRAPAVS